jgi:hypothetical protein
LLLVVFAGLFHVVPGSTVIDDPDTGQIIAYTVHGTYGRPKTIWMDGRAHPSENAPHTWAEFLPL